MAVKHGFSETQEARFPRSTSAPRPPAWPTTSVRPASDRRAHRHDEAEEYVVLSGAAG